jgi:hypothetical protein
MTNVTWLEQNQVLDVATVNVFFVALFDLFENFVKVLNFLFVFVQHFFDNGLTFESEAQKRKDLVNDV